MKGFKLVYVKSTKIGLEVFFHLLLLLLEGGIWRVWSWGVEEIGCGLGGELGRGWEMRRNEVFLDWE